MERMADKEYYHAIKHIETKRKFNKWICGKYLAKGEANNIRIYGDKEFVFCDDVFVTFCKCRGLLLRIWVI